MRAPVRTACVTGCLGFMGSHFTRAALKRGWRVWGIDKMTYAAREEWLAEFKRYPTFEFRQADIASLDHLYEVDYVVNYAAETHVDNSIVDSSRFLHSNIMGVQNLLELIRAKRHYEMPTLVQLSTDEVYGDLTNGHHKASDPLHPSNPYSASKASADMLIMAWHRTHGVPYSIVRPTNNYGIGQYPEKLIPKAVKHLALGKPIPLHGDGSFVRNWLHAEDTASAIMTVLEKGKINRVYNVSGNYEAPNREVIRQVLRHYFGRSVPLERYAKFEYVRQGEDVRYGVDDKPLRELGWSNRKHFEREIGAIVRYYKNKVVW
ncbi:MAG: GDP-mannose 4,6-dehydratase [Elusimicrobia bacterium]|nr:GDP-mannose 4,6-dehydratase [Elusimicrobiota bacterium]